jgi:hypothetical protein
MQLRASNVGGSWGEKPLHPSCLKVKVATDAKVASTPIHHCYDFHFHLFELQNPISIGLISQTPHPTLQTISRSRYDSSRTSNHLNQADQTSVRYYSLSFTLNGTSADVASHILGLKFDESYSTQPIPSTRSFRAKIHTTVPSLRYVGQQLCTVTALTMLLLKQAVD